jgi:hypothetical protein
LKAFKGSDWFLGDEMRGKRGCAPFKAHENTTSFSTAASENENTADDHVEAKLQHVVASRNSLTLMVIYATTFDKTN